TISQPDIGPEQPEHTAAARDRTPAEALQGKPTGKTAERPVLPPGCPRRGPSRVLEKVLLDVPAPGVHKIQTGLLLVLKLQHIPMQLLVQRRSIQQRIQLVCEKDRVRFH